VIERFVASDSRLGRLLERLVGWLDDTLGDER
jgi:hypothetical protein